VILEADLSQFAPVYLGFDPKNQPLETVVYAKTPTKAAF
jgi:hypothetical protein